MLRHPVKNVAVTGLIFVFVLLCCLEKQIMENLAVLMQNQCRVVRLLQWSALWAPSVGQCGSFTHKGNVPSRDWLRQSLKRCPAIPDQAEPGQAEANRLSTVFSTPLELWGLAAVLPHLAAELELEEWGSQCYSSRSCKGCSNCRPADWAQNWHPAEVRQSKIQIHISTYAFLKPCYDGKVMIYSASWTAAACCGRKLQSAQLRAAPKTQK